MAEFNRAPQPEVDAMLRRSIDDSATTGPSGGSKGRTEGDVVSRVIAATMKAGGLGTPAAPKLPPLPTSTIRRGK
jgi:hypothetical protein